MREDTVKVVSFLLRIDVYSLFLWRKKINYEKNITLGFFCR